MPAIMEDQETETTEASEREAAEALSLAGMQELLAGGTTTDADEQETETPAEDTATEEVADEIVAEPEKKPVVEGPSAAMKLLAKQVGIPEFLLDSAVNDAQLQKWVEKVTENDRAPEPEVETPFEFKVELPEDEFGADDNIRKEFGRFGAQVKELVNPLKEEIKSLKAELKSLVGDSEERQEIEHRSESQRFDAKLDELNIPAMGNSAEPNDEMFYQRSTVFNYIREKLLPSNPLARPSDLVGEAIKKLGFTANSKTPEQKRAILDQSAKRLGSGPSKTAPAPKLGPMETYQAILDGKLNEDGSPKS